MTERAAASNCGASVAPKTGNEYRAVTSRVQKIVVREWGVEVGGQFQFGSLDASGNTMGAT